MSKLQKLFGRQEKQENFTLEISNDSYISLEGGDRYAQQQPQRGSCADIIQCMFPKTKKKATTKQGNELRKFLVMLMACHFLFIIFEISLYASVPMALFEAVRLWLCYYGYMTLNTCLLYIYLVW